MGILWAPGTHIIHIHIRGAYTCIYTLTLSLSCTHTHRFSCNFVKLEAPVPMRVCHFKTELNLRLSLASMMYVKIQTGFWANSFHTTKTDLKHAHSWCSTPARAGGAYTGGSLRTLVRLGGCQDSSYEPLRQLLMVRCTLKLSQRFF